ncbi:uncharacterized protein LOC122029334 [Zingiber officinale]|uniref:uncharacterized protein LOC122029334 n=1 Tax=Zingiber officinale TaxID=94328 RepID=UPI001C4B4C09|nr:uncharacterized protein LOC122029334 [Zingiber officinale]
MLEQSEELEPILMEKCKVKASSSSSEGEMSEEEEEMEQRPPTWMNYGVASGKGVNAGGRRMLSKQLSLRETRMEAKWEQRRMQVLQRRKSSAAEELEKERRLARILTDEDMDELRGSIDLGFRFSEEDGGQDLCMTLPALNLYFAVNRQLPTPGSSTATSSSSTLAGLPSPRSPANEQGMAHAQAWKICNPGDDPEHVKTRLKHWAQAVAFSLRQSC